MIFKFNITGREEQVMEFEKELLDILQRVVGPKEMVAYEVHFCVHEALLNIIQHGYNWDLTLPIDIRIDISNGPNGQQVLEIFIKDVGPAIEKPLETPKKPGEFQLRHRGLYMITKIMDEFSVEPQEKSGNVTYMKKTLTTVETPVL